MDTEQPTYNGALILLLSLVGLQVARCLTNPSSDRSHDKSNTSEATSTSDEARNSPQLITLTRIDMPEQSQEEKQIGIELLVELDKHMPRGKVISQNEKTENHESFQDIWKKIWLTSSFKKALQLKQKTKNDFLSVGDIVDFFNTFIAHVGGMIVIGEFIKSDTANPIVLITVEGVEVYETTNPLVTGKVGFIAYTTPHIPTGGKRLLDRKGVLINSRDNLTVIPQSLLKRREALIVNLASSRLKTIKHEGIHETLGGMVIPMGKKGMTLKINGVTMQANSQEWTHQQIDELAACAITNADGSIDSNTRLGATISLLYTENDIYKVYQELFWLCLEKMMAEIKTPPTTNFKVKNDRTQLIIYLYETHQVRIIHTINELLAESVTTWILSNQPTVR